MLQLVKQHYIDPVVAMADISHTTSPPPPPVPQDPDFVHMNIEGEMEVFAADGFCHENSADPPPLAPMPVDNIAQHVSFKWNFQTRLQDRRLATLAVNFKATRTWKQRFYVASI
jgi:hypothetical protein